MTVSGVGSTALDGIVAALKPHLDRPDAGLISRDAWFLGGNAANAELLESLLSEALRGHIANRRAYAPDDPDFIYEDDRDTDAFRAERGKLIAAVTSLNDMLKGSIPLSSLRNQSHMYWDITLPSIAGYLCGMLHNQNQAAAEASPVTTAIEYTVGQQLCKMLGYDLTSEPEPWGHLTAGGTVANVEATWAARNLRFQGVALAHLIRTDPALAAGASVTVKTCDGRRERLLDLSPWELLNIAVDDMLDLPRRLAQTCGIEPDAITKALERFSIAATGLLDFYAEALPGRKAPVMIVPATAHYSWPRAASLSGLGIRHMIGVEVDLDGRMSTVALRRVLDQCLDDERPVIMVVAVMGTTTESAVDPLDEIAEIRAEYRERGLDFAIHADAAWGGYFAAMLRPSARNAESPRWDMNAYVARQIGALHRADTITVDPHKAGFTPYPAGALCYRNAQMPGMITVVADIVYHGGTARTMGACALEGSSPGAAATSVFLSHQCIPPNQSGYGHLLGRCMFNAKRFYAAVTTMETPQDPFTVTPFKRLPCEAAGGTPVEIAAQKALIADKIVGLDNDGVLDNLDNDPALKRIFEEIGPDLTVFNYAFNFRTAAGPNTDLALMNALNMAIFHACSIEQNETHDIPPQELFLTQHSFAPHVYGQGFCDTFAARTGCTPSDGESIAYLVSTMQNPWLTNTEEGNFIPTLVEILRKIVTREVEALIQRHGLPPYKG